MNKKSETTLVYLLINILISMNSSWNCMPKVYKPRSKLTNWINCWFRNSLKSKYLL